MLTHNPDQQRAACNLGDAYMVWVDAAKRIQSHYLHWKCVSGQDYLCRIRRGSSNQTSLGPRSSETEKLYQEFKNWELIAKNGEKRLLVLGRIYRATHLPVIETFAGKVLRALDIQGLLDNKIEVIGTNAIAAYQMEAQHSIDQEWMMTKDFDLLWKGDSSETTRDNELSNPPEPPIGLFNTIKSTDSTWTVSMEHTFRLMNKDLEIVELLVPPSLLKFAPKGTWRAVELESQEELLGGTPVEHVVADLSGRPAKIVAPDPRRFVLHKWLLSSTPERKPAKQRKDREQALQVKALVDLGMPNHPFDEAFVDSVSPRLQKAFVDLTSYEERCGSRTAPHP